MKKLLLDKKAKWEKYENIIEDLENKQKCIDERVNNLEIKLNSFELKQKDFWPIGSIYQTFNDQFDPNTNCKGTWIKVEGKFILGSSNSYKINSVGGEETHQLTIDEMPSHSHDFVYYRTFKSGTCTNTVMSFSENYLGSATDQTKCVGANKNHNNMPPYRVAHIWERIK